MKINGLQRPLILLILDGWGHSEKTKANAIVKAHKPCWDYLWKTFPHTLLQGSGIHVGLPENQMGNSEVGHLNMGAGRIVYQDLTRIDLAIQGGEFFQNQNLVDALTLAKNKGKAVHILGLLSPGGVHSHEKHIHAILQCAAMHAIPSVYIHAFLDGRDTPPQSAMASLQSLMTHTQQQKCGHIVSLIGRYYAMDRDKRWERIQEAYDLLVQGKAIYHAEDAIEGLKLAYARGETDEFVKATALHPTHAKPVTINEGDVVIFMNFRADRAREITDCLINPAFAGFKREKWPRLSAFVCLTQYDEKFNAPVAFPPQKLKQIFAEYISHLGLQQLRIAETEKYAHVTFFFNGGIEHPYPGETRILIPSPQIATYDLQPEMSALELTKRLIQEVKTSKYDVIICNFANPDMLGHTGNFKATVKAIETIDSCLSEIIKEVQNIDGEVLITADHGNAEQLFDDTTGQPHTAHTTHPVPFLYIGRNARIIKENGKLSDISPTLLYLLGLPIPPEMTGEPLLQLV